MGGAESLSDKSPHPTPLPRRWERGAYRTGAGWEQAGEDPVMTERTHSQSATAADLARSSEAAPHLVSRLQYDQRLRWQSGERVLAEAYLAEHPALQADPEGFLDLIYSEALLREEAGQKADLEDYVRRFPQFASQLRLQFEVLSVFRSQEGRVP